MNTRTIPGSDDLLDSERVSSLEEISDLAFEQEEEEPSFTRNHRAPFVYDDSRDLVDLFRS